MKEKGKTGQIPTLLKGKGVDRVTKERERREIKKGSEAKRELMMGSTEAAESTHEVHRLCSCFGAPTIPTEFLRQMHAGLFD